MFALVLIAVGLVLVLATNLGTSADIRKESRESRFLAEMQIALTTVEEAVSAWQLDPTRPHPSVDPEIAAAVEVFMAGEPSWLNSSMATRSRWSLASLLPSTVMCRQRRTLPQRPGTLRCWS